MTVWRIRNGAVKKIRKVTEQKILKYAV